MVYLRQTAVKKQRGMVLIMVMLMLFVMTLLSLGLFETSILETKMSSNFVLAFKRFAGSS